MSADLFSAAGERIALASGVPLSQALAEVKGAPRLVESRGLFEAPACVYADAETICERPRAPGLAGYCLEHAGLGSDTAQALSRGLFETCEHGASYDAECLECEPALDPADAPGPFFTLADAFRPHAFLAGAPSRTSLGPLCQVCDGSPHAAIHAPPC